MDYPLSGNDIIYKVKQIHGVEPNLIAYEELQDYNSVDELLKNDMCVILYQWKKGYGHWTCIMKRGNTIEHFDSFGMYPDGELAFGDPEMNKTLGQGFPHLAKLLIDSPYEIHFSDNVFQEEDSTTCGRWVVFRLWLKNMSEYKFIKRYGSLSDREIIMITEAI